MQPYKGLIMIECKLDPSVERCPKGRADNVAPACCNCEHGVGGIIDLGGEVLYLLSDKGRMKSEKTAVKTGEAKEPTNKSKEKQ